MLPKIDDTPMTTSDLYALCSSYIRSRIQEHGVGAVPESARWAITVSRQEGARGHIICGALRDLLNARSRDRDTPWTLFDDALIQKTLEDHHLPERLERYMPEDHMPTIESLIGELLNLHPPVWELFEKTCQTIIRLATLGNVIIVGRGGNVLCEHLPHVLHVRLIGSETVRARHIALTRGLNPDAARTVLRREDRARERYFQEYFLRDLNQPLLYDLVLNTDRIGDREAAHLIAERLEHHTPQCWDAIAKSALQTPEGLR